MPIANGSILVAHSHASQQTFVADRSVPTSDIGLCKISRSSLKPIASRNQNRADMPR
jgi:hypothetical protein